MKEITILYRINIHSLNETINTDISILNKLYDESSNYYELPINSTKSYKIRHYKSLGEFALYLLSNIKENDFEKDTYNKILNIENYLWKCINNENYCNEKIFLAFIRDSLKISKFPPADIYAYDYFGNITTIPIDLNQKLEIFLKNKDNIKIDKDYSCTNVVDLIVCSLFEIFHNGFIIKRCKSCGKFFVSTNSTAFCNYSSPYNEKLSCLEYSRKTNYVIKRRNDNIQRKYNRICNLLRKRYYDEQNKDIKSYDEAKVTQFYEIFEDFKNEYILNMKPQLLNGELTRDELEKWLDEKESFYKKRRR